MARVFSVPVFQGRFLGDERRFKNPCRGSSKESTDLGFAVHLLVICVGHINMKHRTTQRKWQRGQGRRRALRPLKAETASVVLGDKLYQFIPSPNTCPEMPTPGTQERKQRKRSGGQEVCLAQLNPTAHLPRTVEPKEEWRVCWKKQKLEWQL